MSEPLGRLRVGCSGWLYRHWRGGVFYPAGTKVKDELAYYVSRFDTAELNASFYRMPSEAAVKGWVERTPEDFVFAWKASRYLTHLKRLKDPEQPLTYMFERAEGLGAKLGPILYQLPPGMGVDLGRLQGVLELLPEGRRHAFEFRNTSWYDPAVFDLLSRHDAALVLSDHHHAPAPWVATASWVYVRGHGPGGRYWGDYSEATLQAWAQSIRAWRFEGKDVYAYFDNDIGGAAPRDALRLKRLFNL